MEERVPGPWGDIKCCRRRAVGISASTTGVIRQEPRTKNEHNPAAQGETAIDPPSASPSPRHASCSSNRSCSSSRSCRSCSSNRSCSSSRSCSSGRCLPFYSPGLAPHHQGGGRWSGALRPSSEGGKRSSRTLGRRKRETRTSCLLRNIQKVQTRSPSICSA